MESPEQPNEKDEKENRIALWPGRNREEGDGKPYLTGTVTIDGRKYYVTLWKRDRHTKRQPILSGNVELATNEQLDV